MTRRFALLAHGASSLAVAAVRATDRGPDAPCQRCEDTCRVRAAPNQPRMT